MGVHVTCPACGKRTEISAEAMGELVLCPQPYCQKWFKVDADGQTSMPAERSFALAETSLIDLPESEPSTGETLSPSPPLPVSPSPHPPAKVIPPPIRRKPTPPAENGNGTGMTPVGPDSSIDEDWTPRSRSRQLRNIVVACVLLALAGSGIAGWLLWRALGRADEARQEQARQAYAGGNFAQASRLYHQVLESTSGGEAKQRFQFMVELSDFRAAVANREVEEAYKLFKNLEQRYRRAPIYQEHGKDLWDALRLLTTYVAASSIRLAADDDARGLDESLQRAQEIFRHAHQTSEVVKDTAPAPMIEELSKQIAKAETAVAEARARKSLLDDMARLIKTETLGAAVEAQKGFEAAVQRFPRLAEDRRIKTSLDGFRTKEASWVRYAPAAEESARGAPPEIDNRQGLLICPLLQGNPVAASDIPASLPLAKGGNGGVVLAVARGVLYGLAQSTGEMRWAVRVGIDGHHLPARLRAQPPLPEMAFTLALEQKTLLAVNVETGAVEWHYSFSSPCLGTPILVGRRLYVPTLNGVLHELETVDGRLIGRYEVGLPLTGMATFDESSRRLFIPTDEKRLLVFDVDKNECVAVLHTNHASGSMSIRPMVSGSSLIVTDATGLNTARVRAFPIAVPSSETQSSPTNGPAATFDLHGLPGAAYFDGSRLGLATDRAGLTLFGVRRGTRDKPLFAMTPTSMKAALSRTHVVDVDLNEWWLVQHGELRRYQFDTYRQALVPASATSLSLGTPLHESQRIGGGRFVLVTQSPDGSRCLATAINRDTGTVYWQRQLGITPVHAPLVVGGNAYISDRSGGIAQFNAAELMKTNEAGWRTAGRWRDGETRRRGDGETAWSHILHSPDGSFAIRVRYVSGRGLIIRKFKSGEESAETVVSLPSPPTGTPAFNGEIVAVACRDGNWYQVSLDKSTPAGSLAWRDSKADENATSHAVFASANVLYITDGDKKIRCWSRRRRDGMQDKAGWEPAEQIFELPLPIATRVAVLTGRRGDGETGRAGDGQRADFVSPFPGLPVSPSPRFSLCVGDETGKLHLLPTTGAGKRQWPLGRRITHGPFIFAEQLGCIVDGHRLICLSPDSEQPAWEYRVERPGFCGEPQLHGGRLLVTELSGRFVWLNSKNGQVMGQLRMRMKGVPAVSAAEVSADCVLAPLSDGTILKFRPPATPTSPPS